MRILCHYARMHTALLFALLGCGTTATAERPEPAPSPAPTAPARAESRVAMASVDTLREAMEDASGHVRIFNFWATWCQPCIAELPHLEAIGKEYPDIEVILVSLDHRVIGAPRVKGFLEKQGHSLQSFMLDAEDPAVAVQELYPEFPGAIPITLVYDADGDLSKAYHRSVSLADLRKAVDEAR